MKLSELLEYSENYDIIIVNRAEVLENTKFIRAGASELSTDRAVTPELRKEIIVLEELNLTPEQLEAVQKYTQSETDKVRTKYSQELKEAQAEVETMIMEHPEFYERIKDLDFCEMSPEDLSEMVRITIDHNFKNSMAN